MAKGEIVERVVRFIVREIVDNPEAVKVEIVEEGALGKISYMRARECHSGSHSPYNQTIALCGGGENSSALYLHGEFLRKLEGDPLPELLRLIDQEISARAGKGGEV